MVTRAQAIADIKRGMGYRATSDITILASLDQAQEQLETGKSLPEFLLVYDQIIAVTADVATFSLPEGFLRLHDDYELYYVDTDQGVVNVPLRNHGEALAAYGYLDEDGSVNTRPRVWTRRGKTTGFMTPTPTEAFDLKLTFYKADARPSTLGASDTNLWLTNMSEVLIGEAGMRASANARDPDGVALFRARRDAGNLSKLGEIVEDELAGRGLIMGRNN